MLMRLASSVVPSASSRPSRSRCSAANRRPDQSRPVPRFPRAAARYPVAAGSAPAAPDSSCSAVDAASINASLSPRARATAVKSVSRPMLAPGRVSGSAISRSCSARVRWCCISPIRPAYIRRVAAASSSSGPAAILCSGTLASTWSSAARSTETEQGQGMRHEEPTEECPVAGSGSVSKCLDGKVVVGVPLRRPPVQLGHGGRFLDEEPMAQHVLEQTVVAVPLAARAESDHEGVGALQGLQVELAEGLVGEDLGELTVDALGDGRPHEEALHPRGLPGEHLLSQVVDDRLVVAREVPRAAGRPWSSQEECREPEPHRPALRALHEQLSILGCHHDTAGRHEGHGVGHVESKVPGPDLPEVVGDPQAVEGKNRVGAGQEHQPQARCRVPEETGYAGKNSGVGDEAEVVQNDHHGPTQLAQPICELAQVLPLAAQPGHELGQGIVRRHHPRRPDGCDHVGPEGSRLVVRRIERHPGNRACGWTRGRPCRRCEGLSPPRTRAQQGQGPPCALVEQRANVGAGDVGGRNPRACELGGHQGLVSSLGGSGVGRLSTGTC